VKRAIQEEEKENLPNSFWRKFTIGPDGARRLSKPPTIPESRRTSPKDRLFGAGFEGREGTFVARTSSSRGFLSGGSPEGEQRSQKKRAGIEGKTRSGKGSFSQTDSKRKEGTSRKA